jgi:hypothetical protein
LTLQINSIAALERLLGGNTEFETSIRRSVAADFARNHMKDLVEREFNIRDAELKAQVNAEVNKIALQRDKIQSWTWTLSDDLKTRIRGQVGEELRKVVDGALQEASRKYATMLEAELAKMTALAKSRVEAAVSTKFDKEVRDALDARLKELRNLLPADPPESRRINV